MKGRGVDASGVSTRDHSAEECQDRQRSGRRHLSHPRQRRGEECANVREMRRSVVVVFHEPDLVGSRGQISGGQLSHMLLERAKILLKRREGHRRIVIEFAQAGVLVPPRRNGIDEPPGLLQNRSSRRRERSWQPPCKSPHVRNFTSGGPSLPVAVQHPWRKAVKTTYFGERSSCSRAPQFNDGHIRSIVELRETIAGATR